VPRRDDIRSILIVGSGPIVIGQACEFDYSGSQACKALKQEGYRVVLVNSNPATIMTDPEMADATYVEPITPEVVRLVIEKERPDALLPTLGGQTALNVAVALARSGVLEQLGVELIGASCEAIEKAENRELFKKTMMEAGIEVLRSRYVRSVKEALEFAEEVGYPVIVRPSFTLGGSGGGVGYDPETLAPVVSRGLDESPVGEVLVEESVIGWKEFELEVMRDKADNVVIVCSIENFDPMGVHTGDSITVAPAQTLTDKEYQAMRDAAIRAIRAIGVETGGSNIQFAVHPKTGRMVIIEMNPRVSRSSALASKATGFPIAKIAAKLAVGYTLEEIPNDITKKTPACFEPAIDYCVVKIPRWDFAKFPDADFTLTTQMKSVGEVMAIGRSFEEALQKAVRSLEEGYAGLGADGREPDFLAWFGRKASRRDLLLEGLKRPNPWRLFFVRDALEEGVSVEEINALTGIDPWFLHKIREVLVFERSQLRPALAQWPLEETADGGGVAASLAPVLRKAKKLGYSDAQIAHMAGQARGLKVPEILVGKARKKAGITSTFRLVDTCAAEFEAFTPYYYSTYDTEDEARVDTGVRKVMILGSGPNRIGQGIEFDYCCVQAALAAREMGFQVVMVNCNPETVSTDYDISDKLYFEPLTLEDVLNVYERERPDGVILQFGGQTPLKLALSLEAMSVPVFGTSSRMIDVAEDREKFATLLASLASIGVRQPPNGAARSVEEAVAIARELGYPVLLRPSYVLGGRAMRIVFDEEDLVDYVSQAVQVSFERPVLIDRFLEDAIEVDVDAVSDGRRVLVGAVMEHVELAGIHSGDSACVIPPRTLSPEVIDEIERQTSALALALDVVGLINVQFAVADGQVYVLEVNPRASRTVPFVSKATGMPLAKMATRVMLGQTLSEAMKAYGLSEGVLETPSYRRQPYFAVKEAVLPFAKFPEVDIILGPEMRSTGEVMGIDECFGLAFAKSQMGAGVPLPLQGTVLLTVRDEDKEKIISLARTFRSLGFKLLATRGTARALATAGIEAQVVNKIGEGHPDTVDAIRQRQVDLVINTPVGQGPRADERKMRRHALLMGIPVITTLRGAEAAVEGIRSIRERGLAVRSIQEYHRIFKEAAFRPEGRPSCP